MHEYSIVEALIARVEAEARARAATRVHGLRVRLGEQSGVEAELLATAYETFRAGTVCESAPLELVTVPVRWTCRGCRRAIAPGDVLRCPDCGQPARLSAGDEILLDRIEMEVP